MTSPTGSAGKKSASSDRQLVSSIFFKRSSPSATHCTSTSLPCSALCNAFRSGNVLLRGKSLLRLSFGLLQRGLQSLPLFCVLWLERSEGCLDPILAPAARSCSGDTLATDRRRLRRQLLRPKLTSLLLGSCTWPLRRRRTLATDHL